MKSIERVCKAFVNGNHMFSTYVAMEAARLYWMCGRRAAIRFAEKLGVPAKLVRLAIQLDATKSIV